MAWHQLKVATCWNNYCQSLHRLCWSAAIAVVGFFLSSCAVTLTHYVNSKWPPVPVSEQQQVAVSSAASALAAMSTPNVAAAFRLQDIRQALSADFLNRLGITALTLAGEQQLVRADVAFHYKLTGADAKDDPKVAKLLDDAKPDVTGVVTLYASVKSATVSEAGGGTVSAIQVQLLPAFKHIHVDKLTVDGHFNVTLIGDVLADVLNKYADNVTGKVIEEINKTAAPKLVLPTTFQGLLKPAASFPIKASSVDGKITVTGNAITSPLKLAGFACVVTDTQIELILELIPIGTVRPAGSPTAPVTSKALEAHTAGLVAEEFGVPHPDASTWLAIRTDVLGFALESAIRESNACLTLSAQSSSGTAEFPVTPKNPDDIDCSTVDSCSSQRACNYSPQHDPRSCGHDAHVFGRRVHVPDPVCDATKAAHNKAYELAAFTDKQNCERIKAQQNAACALERASKHDLCELGKKSLQLVTDHGKFGDADAAWRAATADLQVCINNATFSGDLKHVQATFTPKGHAAANVKLTFKPSGIAGHLACVVSAGADRNFAADVNASAITFGSDVGWKTDEGREQLDFNTQDSTLPLSLHPSLTDILLTSPELHLKCPVGELIEPVVALFVPELQGDITYHLKSQNLSLSNAVPEQKVGATTFAPSLNNTGKALVITGTPNSH
jgi:hypothetical protein